MTAPSAERSATRQGALILQRTARAWPVAAMALVAAALGVGGNPAFAAVAVVSITTSVVDTGNSTVRTGISGPGGPYQITYDGIELRLNSFTVTGGTGVPVASGTAVVRRNTAPQTGDAAAGTASNPPQVNAWNAVVSTSGASQTVRGQYFNDLSALYTSQNLWTGTENLMVNANGTAANARNNVERVDYIFSALTTTADTGFLTFDRGRGTGGGGANGPFKVAAITGIDGLGLPTFNGSSVVSVADNTYGDGNLTSVFQYSVFDKAYLNPGYSAGLDNNRNYNIGPQGLSGAFVRFSELVPNGTTVYGYAVFGTDVSGTGSQLNDWTNGTYFPTLSPISNDLDYIASGPFIFAVPEPSTIAMTIIGGMVLWATGHRRSSRNRYLGMPR